MRRADWSTTTSSGLVGSGMRPSTITPIIGCTLLAAVGISRLSNPAGLTSRATATRKGNAARTSGSAATAARCFSSYDGSLAKTPAVGTRAAETKRGTASEVRRAPATPAAASPNVAPASRPRTTHERHRARRSARAHSQAAVTTRDSERPCRQQTTARAAQTVC